MVKGNNSFQGQLCLWSPCRSPAHHRAGDAAGPCVPAAGAGSWMLLRVLHSLGQDTGQDEISPADTNTSCEMFT